MTLFFTIIIGKRLLLEPEKEYTRIFFHLAVIFIYFLVLYFHKQNRIFVRIAPIILAVLSYYGHFRFLTFKNFDNGIGSGQECQTLEICQKLLKLYTRDSNEIMRHVIICGAFFVNHIYVDTFLTVTRRDSLMYNLITWGMFGYSTHYNSSKR